jgi:AraC-like DNA-binding protein
MSAHPRVANTPVDFANTTSKSLLVLNDLCDHLDELFIQKKLFMDKNLKLVDVCKLLKITPRKLGIVLKHKGFRNFAHFINYHKVMEACKYLDRAENNIYTLEAIAEMSNFGSRMAFYNAFAMIVGMKPAQYRAEIKNQSGIK